MKHPNDTDLDFLHECTSDELEFLVRLIIDVGGKMNRLEKSAGFKTNPSDPTKYVPEIIEEIQRFAGFSIRNFLRGYGVPYRTALSDTLSSLSVGFDRRETIEALEEKLLEFGKEKFLSRFKDEQIRNQYEEILANCSCNGLAGSLKSYFFSRFSPVLGYQTAQAIIFPLSIPFYLLVSAEMYKSCVAVPAVLYVAALRRKKSAENG